MVGSGRRARLFSAGLHEGVDQRAYVFELFHKREEVIFDAIRDDVDPSLHESLWAVVEAHVGPAFRVGRERSPEVRSEIAAGDGVSLKCRSLRA